jgi:hypothetical protein
MDHLMNLVATASEQSSAQGGRTVGPKVQEAAAERPPLYRDEIIDTGAGEDQQ